MPPGNRIGHEAVIFVTDDEQAIRSSITKRRFGEVITLLGMNHTVKALLEGFWPSRLVLLDVRMPGIGGLGR
jgi:FixJ family two-component response regulator